jgi:hypothetical protein
MGAEMTRNELLALMRDIDGNAFWKNEGRINKAIAWLEDEGNEKQYVEITGRTDSAPAPKGWLLR